MFTRPTISTMLSCPSEYISPYSKASSDVSPPPDIANTASTSKTMSVTLIMPSWLKSPVLSNNKVPLLNKVPSPVKSPRISK